MKPLFNLRKTAEHKYAYMLVECNNSNIWRANKTNKNEIKVK